MCHISALKLTMIQVLQSDFFHGLYCYGSSCIGKSLTVLNVLEEQNAPFVLFSGYSSPLYFYNSLYENSDKVILIDSCAGISESSAVGLPMIRNMLTRGAPLMRSSALQPPSNKRILRWAKPSRKAAVSEFEFTGKLIIISNKPPRPTLESALGDSCLIYELRLNKEQRLRMIADAAKSKAEKEVYAHFCDRVDDVRPERLNYCALHIGALLFEEHNENWKELLDLS